jgi:hypothetical protein
MVIYRIDGDRVSITLGQSDKLEIKVSLHYIPTASRFRMSKERLTQKRFHQQQFIDAIPCLIVRHQNVILCKMWA